jgi:CubicO group peptidase (beta-lactamase class C family)
MHLFSKIGMNADWWTDELGHAMTYCCIDTTTRDFARFGLLYARNGRWGEDQIVSEAWVKESTTVPTGTDNQNYALQWWVNSSAGYFSSQGLNKNNIYIFPELDLVIVRNSLYTKVGSSSIRTGDNYHATLEPLDWSDSEFLSYITDAINN